MLDNLSIFLPHPIIPHRCLQHLYPFFYILTLQQLHQPRYDLHGGPGVGVCLVTQVGRGQQGFQEGRIRVVDQLHQFSAVFQFAGGCDPTAHVGVVLRFMLEE